MLGGSGFLGVHVARAALALGHEVTAASRDPDAAPIGSHVEHGRRMRVDVLVPGAVERLLHEVDPARVVLCTAISTITEAERYPALARAVNVDLPAIVARWTRARARRLVHVSTDLVFGAIRAPSGGFSEGDEVAPVSEYGRSKARGERAVLDADASALVVRLPLLTGDSFGRGRGASDTVIDAVLRGECPNLFVDEWRTPLAVDCAGRALVFLAQETTHGILHVAGRERLSRHELGLRALAADPRTRHLPASVLRPATRAALGHADRPVDVSLDASRARDILRVDLEPFSA